MYCFVFECIYYTLTLPQGVNPVAVNIYLYVCLSLSTYFMYLSWLSLQVGLSYFNVLFFIYTLLMISSSPKEITQHQSLPSRLQFLMFSNIKLQPIPVAERSKAWVCSRSLAGIAGSNPAGGMDVCLL